MRSAVAWPSRTICCPTSRNSGVEIMSLRMLPVVIVAVTTLACASNTERARAFTERGDRYTASGEYDAAVIEYRNALKRTPDSNEVNRKLGNAYVALSKAEEAYRAYSTAIELDPSDVV